MRRRALAKVLLVRPINLYGRLRRNVPSTVSSVSGWQGRHHGLHDHVVAAAPAPAGGRRRGCRVVDAAAGRCSSYSEVLHGRASLERTPVSPPVESVEEGSVGYHSKVLAESDVDVVGDARPEQPEAARVERVDYGVQGGEVLVGRRLGSGAFGVWSRRLDRGQGFFRKPFHLPTPSGLPTVSRTRGYAVWLFSDDQRTEGSARVRMGRVDGKHALPCDSFMAARLDTSPESTEDSRGFEHEPGPGTPRTDSHPACADGHHRGDLGELACGGRSGRAHAAGDRPMWSFASR